MSFLDFSFLSCFSSFSLHYFVYQLSLFPLYFAPILHFSPTPVFLQSSHDSLPSSFPPHSASSSSASHHAPPLHMPSPLQSTPHFSQLPTSANSPLQSTPYFSQLPTSVNSLLQPTPYFSQLPTSANSLLQPTPHQFLRLSFTGTSTFNTNSSILYFSILCTPAILLSSCVHKSAPSLGGSISVLQSRATCMPQ